MGIPQRQQVRLFVMQHTQKAITKFGRENIQHKKEKLDF